ncbi:MAG: beta-glucosidase [Chromatiales bacterium]|nr:MAG: beta-glucosidase [Chromatiales bacterium]
MKSSFIAALMFAAMAGALSASETVDWPAISSAVTRDPELETRIDAIIDGLSLEQKIGQMVQAEIRHVTPRDVRKYYLGSILNGGGSFPDNNKQAAVADWLALADRFYDASMDESSGRIPIPVIWGTDAVHGHNNVIGATLFPHNIGLGAARNPDLIEKIGEVTAREVVATGIDWVFAPTLAVVRDDRWGRTYEGFSEDPTIVRNYGGRMVVGLQGQAGAPGFLGAGRVVATAKHFIGDGGTFRGVDQGDNLATEQELLDIHGQGYISALESGVQTVMVSFNSWNGKKLHGDRYLLTDVLKQKMQFDGFLVSDWNGIGQVEGCTNSNCAAAVNAGLDMFMVPEDWKAFIKTTVSQVKSGAIPESRIDDAVRRILRVKIRAGLFEKGKPSSRPFAGDSALLGDASHRAVARQAVRESLVLLKNKGGLLPLRRDIKVLVAGDGADNISKQSGGWTITWQGTENTNEDFPGATSIFSGISEAVSAGGGSAKLNVKGDFDEKPDVAIVVFGEEPYAEGQGDRTTLDYSAEKPADVALMEKLGRQNIPVVSIFLTGRPLWVNPELNASDAFVVAWLPGSEGGGIADVLFRDAQGKIDTDFRGKLSFSWPANGEQAEANRFDADYSPLFPYGYGLTYTDADTLSDSLPVTRNAAPAGPGSDSELQIFNARAAAPWKLFVGDSKGWQVPVVGGAATSAGGVVSVSATDRTVQEDARRVSWNGKGEGQVYFQAGAPQDLATYLEQDAAILVDMKVEQPPTKKVTMRMDCQYPCGAKGDLTELMKKVPQDTWFPLSIDLHCFNKEGADFSRIDTPFLLLTRGRLALSFANLRIVPGAAADAVIKCD